jgi:hypothetical protein
VFSEGCGCIAPPPSNEVCDGIDNNCDGSVDESFTQLGTDCAVGSGVCSQGGIFVCNDQGGVRCNADVLEPLTIACEESKGCDGIPESGLVLDQCSVCGGDGKSCQDCSGVAYGPSTLDRCGVCNGDGNSCLGCSNVDLSELLTALDGGAKQQERTVRRILGQLAKSKPNRADRNKVESLKRTAHRLQIRNWTLSWTVPVVTTTCTNTSFCVASSSDWILTEYRKNSEELRQLAIESVALVKRIRRGKFPAVPKLLAIADAQHASNMALADTVPVNNFSCSAP